MKFASTIAAAFAASVLTIASLAGGAAAQEPANLDHLIFAHPSASLSILPFYVAQEKGMFTSAGVEVELARVGAGNFYPALFSGGADVVHSNVVDPMTLRGKGQDVVAIGAFVQNFATQFVFSKKIADEEGIGPSSTLAERIEALRGKTIAVTGQGAGTDQQLRFLLGKGGLDYQRDLTVTFIKDGSAALAALGSGQIDGFIHNSPWYNLAIAQGNAIMMANFATGDVPEAEGYVQGALVTTPEVIAAKKPALVKLMTGLAEAMTFIHNPDNRDEVVDIALKYLSDGSMDPAEMKGYIDTIVETGQVPETPLLNQDQFKVSKDFTNYLLELGGEPQLTYGYDEIVDTTIVNEALKAVGAN